MLPADSPIPPPELPSFLVRSELRLLLFGGKGGVGKTTCAAAAGLTLAQRSPHHRLLLLSVDPAHSLRDCLAGDLLPQNLEVVELDAKADLADWKLRHGETMREIARRGTFLDEVDIERFVSLTLPGIDELLAFLHIAHWLSSGVYQTIIVDTAPSGHTLRLLAMPTLMHEWLDALDSLLGKHRYMKRLFQGSYRPDAADDLIVDLSRSTSEMQRLLHSDACVFVPVVLPELLSLYESKRLAAELTADGIAIGPLLVNRLVPVSDCDFCQQVRADQIACLTQDQSLFRGREVWGVQLLPDEVRGSLALSSLFPRCQPISIWLNPADSPLPASAVVPARVRNASPLPGPAQELILIAGKGGVGKTTIACATALRLSDGVGLREVVLVSTDPAHSIGDCLGLVVAAEPLVVQPRLLAIAIDADREWLGWRERYRDELEALLSEALPNLDLTFDRQVLERLFALSPPGIDELMALIRVIELRNDHPSALFVIDTAPTGHLLRLLEMPELLDGWLRALFAVLLKYRGVLRLPQLSEQLVALSKRLKALRAILHNPQRAQLWAVAIPTQLSLAETSDLLQACQRLRIAVDRLIINQCTPRTRSSDSGAGCSLCAAINAREAETVEALTQAAAGSTVSVVDRGETPIGVARLSALGAQLLTTSAASAEKGPK